MTKFIYIARIIDGSDFDRILWEAAARDLDTLKAKADKALSFHLGIADREFQHSLRREIRSIYSLD